MDRRGTTLVKLGLFSALFLAVTTVAAEQSTLREMNWLAPEGRLEALSGEPVTRIQIGELNRENIQKIMIGEALFHTPTLLGGQAAKAGISCASCHTNGRTNPHFQFPGISGTPGTADVTNSFFSSHRGDGSFNPVLIPDLTEPGKISHDPKSKELEKFVRGLIVEEFDGADPGIPALAAVGAYIRSLAPSPLENAPITVEVHLDRVEKAIESARTALWGGDRRLAKLLFAGARHQTGLIHQRFQGKSFKKEKRALEDLGQQLGAIQRAVDGNDKALLKLLEAWSDGFSRARDTLGERTNHSLYNPAKLKIFLAQSKSHNANAD